MNQRISAYFLIAIPILLVYAPLLFMGKAFADGDVVLQQYTSLQFLRDSLRAGDSLAWNPNVLTGFIPVVGLMGGLLSWLNQILYQTFPVIPTFSALIFLNILLTGIFTYELLRKLNLSRFAAVFAGIALPLANAYFIWSPNMTVSAGNVLLPALLLFVLQIHRAVSWARTIAPVAAGGLFFGTWMLPAHFQWTLQALFIGGVWTVFLAVPHLRARAVVMRTVFGAAILVVVATAVFWPQFRASVAAQEFSARQGGVSYEDAALGSLEIGDALSLVFPRLHLPQFVSQAGLLYIGALPMFLVLVSFWGARDRYYKFFVGVAVFSILVSIKSSPVLWLVHELPLLDSFRALSRFMYVGVFALVVLSAYGFDKLFVNSNLLGRRRTLTKWLSFAAIAAFGLFLLWSALFPKLESLARVRAESLLQARMASGTLSFPLAHYHQVIDRTIEQLRTESTFPHLAVSAAILSLVFAALLIHFRPRLPAIKFAYLALFLTALNLVLTSLPLHTLIAADQLTAKPPVVEYLRQDQSEFRIFTTFAGFTPFDKLDTPYGYNPKENIAFLQNLLAPNMAMYYGLDGFDYYDNILDRRHSKILAYIGSDRSQEIEGRLADEKISLPEKITIFLERLPVLSAYNVKYIVSAYELDHPDLRLAFTWTATTHNIPLYLYENLKVRPRNMAAADIEFAPILSEEESWKRSLAAAERRAMIVECEQCPEVSSGLANFRQISKRNAEYVFEVNTQTPQMFIFGQNFLPGWEAFVDGQAVHIYRANYVNQAIVIPPGHHQVVFLFSL